MKTKNDEKYNDTWFGRAAKEVGIFIDKSPVFDRLLNAAAGMLAAAFIVSISVVLTYWGSIALVLVLTGRLWSAVGIASVLVGIPVAIISAAKDPNS